LDQNKYNTIQYNTKKFANFFELKNVLTYPFFFSASSTDKNTLVFDPSNLSYADVLH
jgi:hypothetical protein